MMPRMLSPRKQMTRRPKSDACKRDVGDVRRRGRVFARPENRRDVGEIPQTGKPPTVVTASEIGVDFYGATVDLRSSSVSWALTSSMMMAEVTPAFTISSARLGSASRT